MITVIKRNGDRVLLDISKIQRQVANACRGIDGVSPSMIEIKAQIEIHDEMTTETIDGQLLKAMVNLIDETENPEINNEILGKKIEIFGKYLNFLEFSKFKESWIF
jgi:anaerobic ribonucleoside-triphosphate reductase